MSEHIPVVVVASMDLVARQAFCAGLLLDLPGVAVLSHDFVNSEGGGLRRVVADREGVRYDDRRDLDHACLACAVREDLVPTLRQLTDDGRWSGIVVALPVSADPCTVIAALEQAIGTGSCGQTRIAAAVSLVDPGTLVEDLFGDDLLAERQLALGAMDRRAVGEALARQIESADLIATTSEAAGMSATLLQHLAADTETIQWPHVDAEALLARRWSAAPARSRTDPLAASPSSAAERDGVWTVDLSSARPFHPGRLMERIEDLGRGRFRSRGHFWLLTRPGVACVWDGSGGQLSIGNQGPWGRRPAGTRLVITGIDAADRDRVREAFRQTLATPAELLSSRWAQEGDEFGPWLDEYVPAA